MPIECKSRDAGSRVIIREFLASGAGAAREDFDGRHEALKVYNRLNNVKRREGVPVKVHLIGNSVYIERIERAEQELKVAEIFKKMAGQLD